ncbi:MAG: hypothetical protein V2B15_06155 [Bacteroidota bacterium]
MRNKAKILSFIIVIILCISGGQLFGQRKINLSTGIGFTELINIGTRFRIGDQVTTGVYIGWWPPSQPGILSWGNLMSLSGGICYHFAGSSSFSNLRPVYIGIRLNGIMDTNDNWNMLILDSNLRIGRDFYLTKDIIIEIDGGIAYNINHKETGVLSFLPVLGIRFLLAGF